MLAVALGKAYLEGQTNRVEMMFSASVVKAFLRHQYYRNLDAAADSFTIALELLRVADYYNVMSLWNDIVNIFLASSDDWFQVGQVFEAFEFLAKCSSRHPAATQLLQKLIKVLVK